VLFICVGGIGGLLCCLCCCGFIMLMVLLVHHVASAICSLHCRLITLLVCCVVGAMGLFHC